MPQCELLKERRSGAVEKWAAETFASPGDVDEAALVQRFENRSRANSPYLFDFRSAYRLPVSDYGESFERRRGQALRPRGQLGSLDCLGVLWAGKNLPAAGDFDQLDSVTVGVVVLSQLLERRIERRLAIVGVGGHEAQRVDRNGNSAREERRLKQLR